MKKHFPLFPFFVGAIIGAYFSPMVLDLTHVLAHAGSVFLRYFA